MTSLASIGALLASALGLLPAAVFPTAVFPAECAAREAAIAGTEPGQVVAGAEERDALQELLQRGRDLEAEGRLAEALDAWMKAITALATGAERDACVARALALQARLALRLEIREAFPRDKTVFGELGIRGVDAAGMLVQETPTEWSRVTLDLLSRAAACAQASRQARQGLVHEMLARGDDVERKRALEMLARLLERGDIEPSDAWQAVARARGEALPPGGYVWHDGAWTAKTVLVEAAQASGLEMRGRTLESAGAAERDAALAAIEALGPEARARMEVALRARWDAAFQALRRSKVLAPLAAVADARRVLDEKRAHALELIFDEERYFYPYSLPECPAEKARLYAGVQHEVDERVAAVRAAWDSPRRASSSGVVREALRELAWNAAQQTARKLAFALPADIAPWVLALDPERAEVDVRTWAWDRAGRAACDLDAAVLALNARRTAEKQADPLAATSADEIRQLEVTNEYRRMLGRRVLAWNPKLQVASQGHSDRMSLTGEFGHFEKDPKRKTPGDRMRLAGYTGGGGENCHMGGGPDDAHQGWIHSSGHHRNILEAGHREMGTASAGIYWTQNFGSGKEYEAQLAAPAHGPEARPKSGAERPIRR